MNPTARWTPRRPARRPSTHRRVVATVLGAMALATLPAVQATSTAQAATPSTGIRLIASRTPVVDRSGAVWWPDSRFAVGGRTRVRQAAIGRTSDDKVFRAERWGLKGYDIPVPAAGRYRVTLNTAELTFHHAGQRVFAVSAQGHLVTPRLDAVRAVGFGNAYSYAFVTDVTDGVLRLRFTAKADLPKISSVRVEPVTAQPVVARVVAGPRAVRDVTGQVWSPDTAYADGGRTWTSTAPINGTADDRLYQSERWGVTGYQVPVPRPGTYRVTLRAAELVFNRPGQRVFSIVAEGRPVVRGLDLVKAVGPGTAYTVSFSVTVTDGALTLRLPASTNHAKVSSLLVEQAASAQATVSSRKPKPAPSPTTTTSSPSPSVTTTTPATTTTTTTAPATTTTTTAPSPTSTTTAPATTTTTTTTAPATTTTTTATTTTTPATTTTTTAGIWGSPMTVDPVSPRGGPFGSQAFWRQSVATAPLAANSAALSANLAGQVARYYNGVAAFNVWQYTQSYYTVGSTQARVNVIWDDCQHKGYVPSGLLGTGGQFTSVALPSNAEPSAGTDHSISVYQPSTDTLWSFWKAYKQPDGWHACWGGRLDHASTSPGYFSGGFGTTATGLAGEGGAVNIRDVQAGSINHALVLQVVDAATWNNFSWPAQRSDGQSTATDAIPEGTRFRLDPTLDVSKLNLHPIAAMVARAAQTYGFVVSDRAGAVSVVAEDGAAAKATTGVNPWDSLLGGTPGYAVMKNFPWYAMQALPRDYGKP